MNSIYDLTAEIADLSEQSADELRIDVGDDRRNLVLDFGVNVPGGLEAGLQLAEMCLGGLARVELQGTEPTCPMPHVFVQTDHPLAACLHSQYAGWKIATEKFFAMGSGPMRALAGQEDLFKEFPPPEADGLPPAVGILETDTLPTPDVFDELRKQLGNEREIRLAVAPTSSPAGTLQVVARSVETAMHKLLEIGFPIETVSSGTGLSPLPPVAQDDLAAIGRTNDSILYGTTVHLWVDCGDDVIEQFGPRTPSNSSDAHGRTFAELFQEADCDFYAMDKLLFSPAVVWFHNLQTGRSFVFGKLVPELLRTSFGLPS